MKIIKVMVSKNRTPEATSFQYPEGWDSQKINVLAYEDNPYLLGECKEYCIGLIHDDEYVAELLKSEDVEEIDEATANELGDKCKPQRLIVDDAELPTILVALKKAPSKRTAHENRMLDEDSEIPGIRKTTKFNVRNWFPQ